MLNQAYLANFDADATHKMTYDGASGFTFTILHGFKPSPADAVTWETAYQSITDNAYGDGDIDDWVMLSITPDLKAHGVVKFTISDGTNDYITNELDMDGLTTLRLWVNITETGLTGEAGIVVFAQAV